MSQPTYTSKSLTNGIHALTGGTNPDTGTPITCLAGWPQTAESFAEVFPLLAKDHHVLILDPPGLGSSAPRQDYTTKTISSILAAAVSAELGDQTKYHLIAHDIGAWIAYAWACLLPPLQFPLPDAANLRLWQFSFNALLGLPEILTQGKERELLDWFFDLKCVHPERITRAKRDHYVTSYSKPGGMTNGFNYYRAFAGSGKQFVDEFSQVKIPVPVLAIGAEKGMGSAMKSVLGIATTEAQSRSKLVVIEDCGHFVPEEQPEIMAKEVLVFIGTC